MGAIPFTQAALAKLVGMQGARLVIKDPKTTGLRAELREGGTVAFYLFRRMPGGRPIRCHLGPFPDVTVDAARDKAAKLYAAMLDGKNPAQAKRAKRGEATLKELFEHWLEHHGKPHKKTWADDERQFKKYLVELHNRKLSAITKADVQAWHAKVGSKNGRYQANRTLALLRSVFNKADDLGFEGANPAAKVKPFKEQSRDRFLQADELPRFFDALKGETEVMRDFFMLALFTGARRSNVASMRWADVDMSQASWRIPETKQRKVQHVPLTQPAMAILKRRQEQAAGSPYVLPSYGKSGHVVEVKGAWKRIKTAAGLDDIRPHDLRRTLGSYMAINGASLNIVGAALGHRQASTTQVYARLTSDVVADGMGKAVKFIETAAKPKKVRKAKGVDSK